MNKVIHPNNSSDVSENETYREVTLATSRAGFSWSQRRSGFVMGRLMILRNIRSMGVSIAK
jgi:hypothetical protein